MLIPVTQQWESLCRLHKLFNLNTLCSFVSGGSTVFECSRVVRWTEKSLVSLSLWRFSLFCILIYSNKIKTKNQLSSEVTAEDMTELLVEESKRTLRVQWVTDTHSPALHLNLFLISRCHTHTKMWGTVEMKLVFSFCLKALGVWAGGLWHWRQTASQAGKTAVLDRLNSSLESTVTLQLIHSVNVSNLLIISRSLFQVWEVNTSMKMRDVEFEARRLLRLPEAAPPQFQWVTFDTRLQTAWSMGGGDGGDSKSSLGLLVASSKHLLQHALPAAL